MVYALKDWNTEDSMVTVLRLIVTLTTIPLLYLIYRHYQLDLYFRKAKETLNTHGM